MRRQMVLLAALGVVAVPIYATAINPALAAYYASLGISAPTTSQVVSQPVQTSAPVVNTTSPYSGFNSSGTPTNSYMGTVAPVVSPAPSTGNSALDSYYRSLGISSTVVNNTSTTTQQQYTPQVVTTVPTSSAGSVSTAGMSPALLAYYRSLGIVVSTPSSPTTPTISGPSVQGISNPEPGTILMMASGLAAVALFRRRRQNRAQLS